MTRALWFLLGAAIGYLLVRRRAGLPAPDALSGVADGGVTYEPTIDGTTYTGDSRWLIEDGKVHISHSVPAKGDWQTWTIPDGMTWAQWLDNVN